MSVSRIALVVAAVAAAGAAAWWFARSKGPNVLVIVMDTTRADRCSFLGYGRPTTPRLEELAKSSTVFTDTWAPSCWTGPSHASLFTGLSPANHGFRDGNRLFLDDQETTLAERFRDAGWRTACFSNNDVVSPRFGLAQGFETMVPEFDDEKRPYPWATATHERALEWALEKGGKPFFLFINDMEPHLKYEPPPAIAAKFVRGTPTAAELEDARAFQYPWSVAYNIGLVNVPKSKLDLLSDLYDAEIATLDAELGKLFDGLAAAGVLDDTIVVVCADHGESLGEHRRIGHLFTLHRTVLHVPLLVRFPGAFDGGRRMKDVARLEDVAPTLLELAGIGVPSGLDGLPLTKAPAGRVATAEFGEQTQNLADFRKRMREEMPEAQISDVSMFSNELRSAYDGRFHYIRDKNGREELYDVAADPLEANDLAPAGGADLVRLRGLLPK